MTRVENRETIFTLTREEVLELVAAHIRAQHGVEITARDIHFKVEHTLDSHRISGASGRLFTAVVT